MNYRMRKIQIIIGLVVIVLMTGNYFYFKNLYNKEVNNDLVLVKREVQVSGESIDNIDNKFASDLNQSIFSKDVEHFFSDPEQQRQTVDRMKLFFSKYESLVTGIKLYDSNKNEFTLKKDETGNNWLEQNFILHVQGEIVPKDTLVREDRFYEYYLPVIDKNTVIGNIVVTIDYQKYFRESFTAFCIKDYQWQWVLSDSGEIIFSNDEGKINYSKLKRINESVLSGEPEDMIHTAERNGKNISLISCCYPTQLLQRNFGIIFSTPIDSFKDYIVKNSLVWGSVSLILLLFPLVLLLRFIKSQVRDLKKQQESEKTLLQILEELPVGIIIQNDRREILKVNKKAADLYSYSDSKEMEGKIRHEPDIHSYFSQHLGSAFSPEQFEILTRNEEEIILFKSKIPVKFRNENASLELLVDVTSLELARKQEASASSAKSEFLGRMSYEIRTPLNGIIGMTDILEKQNLPDKARDFLNLLRRSAEVLLSIINDILDFSKIEAGKLIIDEIPFNLREEVVYCFDLARTSIDESVVSFSCDVDDRIPDKLIGDPYRLRQVITNFLNHSVQSTSMGKINLLCRLKEINNKEIKLFFEVSDTGRVYDTATLKKLFGDYVNIESKVHTNDDESGFGRILARQLVGLMGGDFYVVSPSGLDGERGTKITFTISVNVNEKTEKKLHLEDISAFCKIRTLVITGSEARDEEIMGTLHKLGLSLKVTTYQKLTINQIKTNQDYPDKKYHLIIILDDKEFDGFIAAKEINESNLSGLFVIAVISSNDRKGNLLKCITLGVDHYIIKPCEISELYDVLKASFPQVDNSVSMEENEKIRKDLRILIVEDNKMNQKVIGTMLKSLGYSFDFADDGFAGFIQAKTRRYDVIFMDLLMPEMDGFESARKILEYDSSLQIVAFTADNLPESKRKAELSGIKEFIPKPVRIEDLKKFFSRFLYQPK
jgi:signal transduction histidine kinase/CheY-like chemotaxis protein